MLNEFEQSILKALVHNRDYWNALCRLRDEMIGNWGAQVPSSDDQFQYLKNSFERDGKLAGLAAFFSELERMG